MFSLKIIFIKKKKLAIINFSDQFFNFILINLKYMEVKIKDK